MTFFPERFDYYPSEKEGWARVAGIAVLISSGSGEMAEAAASVAYAKLCEVEKQLKDIVVRVTKE